MAAEAAISAVVQLIGDLLIQNVSFFRGIDDEVQLLITELKRMQSFLKYANKKQTRDERVRTWISEIREVALDAEDTIEKFSNMNVNVDNSRKRKYDGLIDRITFLPNQLLNHHEIRKDIKSILARLDAIEKSREMYGIKDLEESGETSGRSEVEARRRLSPWEKDDHLVGVEDDVKKLLELIMDEEKKGLSITAVAGMGGIGKSTVAREVYNHPDVVSGQFDCRGWVVVSSEFTPQETIKQLILETSPEEEKEQRLDEINGLESTMKDGLYLEDKLKKKLSKQLEGKSYFIVLDDVWKKEDWDSLMTAFPNKQDKTSRLLLTTRIDVVANQFQRLHKMKLLDDEKSWEPFLKKGMNGNSSDEFPKELEQIGRDIVKKCEGLPLSITVMGGLLAEKLCNRDWEEALDELNAHIERGKSNVSAILELSYQNLSAQLKCCFLSLAFFKEDSTIPVKSLVDIMVGLGFIQRTGRSTTTVEEIARDNLYELINRNVVQVKDLTLDRVKSCQLHDSLREICLEKAEEELGLQNLMGGRRNSLPRPRHRVVQSHDLKSFSMNKNKYIRSLFLDVVEDDIGVFGSSYWKGFQHLKILDIEDTSFNDMRELPDFFQFLLGLKQLKIHRRYDVIGFLIPTWLNTLKKLELLDLGFAQFQNVPLEMDSLRHIYLERGSELMITNRCTNLETLKYIHMTDWMKSSIRLMDGCPIRKLGIFIDDDDYSGVSGSLEKLEDLVRLYFLSYRPIDASIIPHHLRNLTKVKLSGRMSNCPSASMFPPNLSHLTLEKTYLEEDPMAELSKLPKLLYLKLHHHSYLGVRMQVLRGGFPRLRGLFLQSMYRLIGVDIEEGGMPQLKLFQVYNCPHLDSCNLLNRSFEVQNLGNLCL